jgi:tetratricopeptide (TPR) repeat protein
MLVPVLGLVGSFFQSRADNYTYLSQIGISIAVAWGVSGICESRPAGGTAWWRPWLVASASGFTILLLAAVAWKQTSYWRNTETVWTRAVACEPKSALAQMNLGAVYAKQGKVDEAISHLREAVAAYSVAPLVTADAHVKLAGCLALLGKHEEELEQLREASQIGGSEAFLAPLAVALARAGKLDEAVAQWREIRRQFPDSLEVGFGLADALLAAGQAAETIDLCRDLLKREPDSAKLLVTMGGALYATGQIDEAIVPLRRAVAVDPKDVWAHFRLGLALNDLGQTAAAMAQLEEAIRLQDYWVLMLWQTAWILATSPDSSIRDGKRAVDLAKRAIQFSQGAEIRAFDALAAGLAETGDFEGAVKVAQQASLMALARNDLPLLEAIEARKHLYGQKLPFRQPAVRSSDKPAPAQQ